MIEPFAPLVAGLLLLGLAAILAATRRGRLVVRWTFARVNLACRKLFVVIARRGIRATEWLAVGERAPLTGITLGALVTACLFACAPLSPAAAQAIQGTVTALCPFESLIPVAGPIAAAACPNEEQLLATVLAAAEGTNPRDPQATVPVFRPGLAGLVHVGNVARSHAAAVQRALLATKPPSPAASLTVARAPLPPAPGVLPTLDAGKDGSP